MDQVKVRVAEINDIPFIYNSWLKSYRDAAAVKTVSNPIYYAGQHELIEDILKSPNAMILVACNKEDDEQICSYVVAELNDTETLIHWVYSKHTFRNLGIAKHLIGQLLELRKSDNVVYTHQGKNTDKVASIKHLVYNPYKQRS